MKILYVEDNPHDASLLQRELARQAPGITVFVVPALSQARQQLAVSAETKYDLALIDLHLPDGSGMELLAEIRREALPLAAIILTGAGDETAAVAALKAGADDYLVKRGDYLDRLPLALETALKRFHAEAARKSSPLKVLYVEDNAFDVDLARRHLARFAPHIHLEAAHDASEALQRLTTAAGKCDLLLLDYSLPGLSALELLKKMQQEYNLALPVVLVTGQGDEESAVQALRLGAVDYLTKHPGYLFQLPAAIENAYHRASLAREQIMLRESERKFRNIFNYAGHAIFIHAMNGKILEVNQVACVRLAYSREELLTMTVTDLESPENINLFPERIKLLQLQGHVTFETAHLRRDGSKMPAEISMHNMRYGGQPAVISVAQDISERKQAQEAERQAARHWQKTFDASADAICLLDLQMNILRANHAMAELTGMEVEELIGRNCCIIIHGEEQIVSACPVKQTGKLLSRQEVELQRGSEWFNICVDPVPGEDSLPQYMVHVIRDITARKKMENSLHRRLAELEALHRVSSALRSAETLEEMLPVMLDETLAALQTDAGAILLYHPASEELRFTAARGWFAQPVKVTFKAGVGISGKVFASGQPYISREFAVDPRIKQQPGTVIPVGWGGACIPVKTSTETVGVLFISVPLPREITAEESGLLLSLAEMAGIAVHRLNLHEDTLRAYDNTIEGWVHALDLKDKETEGHSRRVTEMTISIARAMKIKQDELVHVRRGALLHDIGKMGIPDAILLKPGKPTDEEWEILYRHPRYAYEMLIPIKYLHPALDIPYCHHEKWDGTGYPRGLKGEKIPLAARIFAVVDVFDALTSERPYRPAWSKEEALEYIRAQSGKHFDPQVVALFLQQMKRQTDTP